MSCFVYRIAGYIALYLIGWSPALWTFGYLLLTGGGEKGKESGGTVSGKAGLSGRRCLPRVARSFAS